MIDHPNQFPIGQQVLFRSRADYGEDREWAAGSVLVVRAADRKDSRREAPSLTSDRFDAMRRLDGKHTEDCEWIYYDVLTEDGRYEIESHRKLMLCVCAYEILRADDPDRWTGQRITTRSEYKLLLMDLERQGQEFNGYAQADNAVHLMVDGRLYATINTTDLLHWAAERAG